MYGFPLTIYLLSGWLQSRYPGVDWFAHDSGHLPEMLMGWQANPHFGPFHLASILLIGGGFILLARAWPVLYRGQRDGVLADRGPYARIRHPQYVAFAMILFGFLVQWPTLLTVLMFSVLLFMYRYLALREEREAEALFGKAYRRYAERVLFRAATPATFRRSGDYLKHPSRELQNDFIPVAPDSQPSTRRPAEWEVVTWRREP